MNDYAARVWSGLIRDYYVHRWRAFFEGLRHGAAINLDLWEENWVSMPYEESAPIIVKDLSTEVNEMLFVGSKW